MVKSIALLLPIYVTLMWALVFLLQKKSAGSANRVLGIFMITATILYLCHTIFFHQFYHLYSFIDSLYLLALLSLYPLFYAYILKITNQYIDTSRYMIHFLPAIIISLISLILNFALSPDERVMYVREILISRNLKDLDIFTITGFKGILFLIGRIIFICHAIIYLLLGIRLANKYNDRINDYYSNTEGRKMNWVRNLGIIILIISFAGIAFALIGRSYFAHHPLSLLMPSLIFSSIYFLIGFYGNQQQLSNDNVLVTKGTVEFEEITSGQEKKLKTKLAELFEKDKIYRQHDLRITTISEALQTNRTYISRLINEEFGQNFNEFVNQYRVREAEQLLLSKENNPYTLDYIAEQVGFGSGNSFTRAFKEFNGVTPGQFRKNH